MNKKKKAIILLIDILLIGGLVLIDQYTKKLAVTYLMGKAAIPIIPDIFELQYLENRGAAFGIMQNQKNFFLIGGFIILIIIAYVMYKTLDNAKLNILRVLLVFISAGAIGNMIDRALYGYVIDFFYFKIINFPIFNMADCYVSVSTIILVLLFLFYFKEEDLDFIAGFKKKSSDADDR